jgi:hypothetical protein
MAAHRLRLLCAQVRKIPKIFPSAGDAPGRTPDLRGKIDKKSGTFPAFLWKNPGGRRVSGRPLLILSQKAGVLSSILQQIA